MNTTRELPSRTTIVIHDVDRDGFGAAAMICAEFGPENVVLHPTKAKDVRPLLARQEASRSVMVLDIPAPPSWDGVSTDLTITWVDHHIAAWRRAPPPNVKTILPATSRPTTTMSLLVEHGFVTIPNVIDYVRNLCGRSPEFGWGHAFDTMRRTYPDWPVAHAELPPLLALGPKGKDVPAILMPLVNEAVSTRDECRSVLDVAPTQIHEHAVVVEIADARRIPLAHYSLETQRRHPGRVAILVHRGSTLYCGRASGRHGLDFVKHFQARGLDPKGHPYVVSVRVRRDRVLTELDALLRKLQEASDYRSRPA